MLLLAQIVTAVVALIHIYIVLLETVLFDLNASMGEGASFLIPIRLMVSEQDEAAARRILDEARGPKLWARKARIGDRS